MILRDTGSTQTLLVADECSLDKMNFTGKNVLIQDVNSGYKPVPLYDIELQSPLVSGVVEVGVVPELPMRGISLLLGNDLAGGKVLPSPIVCDYSPVVDSNQSMTDNLESDVSGSILSCVETSAQVLNLTDKEVKDDNSVMLSDTFLMELFESWEDPMVVEAVVSQVSQSALILAQKVECAPNQIESAHLDTGHDLDNYILSDVNHESVVCLDEPVILVKAVLSHKLCAGQTLACSLLGVNELQTLSEEEIPKTNSDVIDVTCANLVKLDHNVIPEGGCLSERQSEMEKMNLEQHPDGQRSCHRCPHPRLSRRRRYTRRQRCHRRSWWYRLRCPRRDRCCCMDLRPSRGKQQAFLAGVPTDTYD